MVHNRIYCDNSNHPNGAMFHMLSGEVRDNEINVPGTALHISTKLAIFRFAQGIEITGNSLISSGLPNQKIATYALAMPKGSDQFRNEVDAALGYIYSSGGWLKIFRGSFGNAEPSELMQALIVINALAE